MTLPESALTPEPNVVGCEQLNSNVPEKGASHVPEALTELTGLRPGKLPLRLPSPLIPTGIGPPEVGIIFIWGTAAGVSVRKPGISAIGDGTLPVSESRQRAASKLHGDDVIWMPPGAKSGPLPVIMCVVRFIVTVVLPAKVNGPICTLLENVRVMPTVLTVLAEISRVSQMAKRCRPAGTFTVKAMADESSNTPGSEIIRALKEWLPLKRSSAYQSKTHSH